MNITPDTPDSEIAAELRKIQQQQRDLDKIEQVANSPWKVCFGVLEALCRECLRLRAEVEELRGRLGTSAAHHGEAVRNG